MKIQWIPIFTLDESLFINLKHMNQSYFHYYLPDFYVHYVLSTWFFHDFWSDLTGIPILWPKTRLNFAAMRTWCHFFFQKVTFEWNLTSIFSNVTWCHLMSLDVTWCHLMSLDVTWCHLMSLDVTWCHLMSLDVTWCHLMSLDVTWCHLMSLRFSKWMIFMIFFWCEQRREWGLLGWLWRYLWDHFPIPHQALSLDSICFSGHLESTFFASHSLPRVNWAIGHTWEPNLNCKLL